MDGPAKNLRSGLWPAQAEEEVTPLVERPGLRIERILSWGQATPEDRPYVQAEDEWVLLFEGAARLEMEGREIALEAGDHLLIPAGCRHRVAWTDPERTTIWLAVHFGGA